MNGLIDYFFVSVVFLGFLYGFFKQIQYTIVIIKSHKKVTFNMLLVGNIITTFAFAGFLISLALNLTVYYLLIDSLLITSNSTAFSAFLFLVILFIAKFKIAPAKTKQNQITL